MQNPYSGTPYVQQPEWYAPPTAGGQVFDPYGSVDSQTMLEPGGFWIRALARVIDGVALSATGFVAGVAAGLMAAALSLSGLIDPGWEQRMDKVSVISFLGGAIGTLTYEAFAEGLGGTTVGKLVCGLRVISVDRRPCTVGKAIGRNLAYYVDALFFGIVGYSAMTRDRRVMQRHGDRWAGTLVVRASSMPASAARSPGVGVVVGVLAGAFVQCMVAVLATL